jgi:hypothetical protein
LFPEHLLTGFFEYYSTFYYEFIICPYFGTELSRASFKAKALVGLDLWLTCAYPQAAEHFKVGIQIQQRIQIQVWSYLLQVQGSGRAGPLAYLCLSTGC